MTGWRIEGATGLSPAMTRGTPERRAGWVARAGRMLPGAALTVVVGAALGVPLALVLRELAVRPVDLGAALDDSWSAAVRTVLMAAGVSALSLPVAAGTGYALSRASARVRALGVVLCGVPLVLNLLVVILSWMVVFENDGLVRWAWAAAGLPGGGPRLMFTPAATVFAMVYVVTPVMSLLLLSSFARINPRTREAAHLLGASVGLRFFLVELGYVAPSLLTAFVLGYVVSLNLYLVPEYLTGPDLTTLGFLVQQDVVTTFDVQLAAAQSVLLLLAAVVPVALALLAEWRLRRR